MGDPKSNRAGAVWGTDRPTDNDEVDKFLFLKDRSPKL